MFRKIKSYVLVGLQLKTTRRHQQSEKKQIPKTSIQKGNFRDPLFFSFILSLVSVVIWNEEFFFLTRNDKFRDLGVRNII